MTEASAAEPWQPFLEGLRERGLHDVAVVYLDRMAADPRCPADLREVIDYEAGVSLMAGSRASRLAAPREKSLDDARARFEKFLAEHPNHSRASLAAGQLANLLVERGRIRAERARRPATLAAQRETLLAEAREFYTQAHAAFDKARKQCEAAMAEAGGVAVEGTPAEKKNQLQGDLLRTRLYLATAVYEIGMTYPPGSRQRKEKLTEAAADYHALYDEFAVRREEPLLAGLYARLWEGRCRRELGDDAKAIAICDELLEKVDGDSLAVRELILQTLVQSLAARVQPRVHCYAEAVDAYVRWEKTARGAEASTPEGLAIQGLAGEAWLEQARAFKKGDPRRAKTLATAHRLLRAAARAPGEHRARAKAKLLDPLLAGRTDSKAEPANFTEAFDRAESARERLQAAESQQQLDRDAGKTEKRAAHERKIAQFRTEAISFYRTALALATAETAVDQINLTRYYLAYLHLEQNDRYDAAALGEFLARRYPESAEAPGSAKLAMVAYAQLYNQSPAGPGKEFARRRMAGVADYITSRWPDGPEAGDARIILVQSAVVGGDLEAARAYLDKFPADSPGRGRAELLIGRTYWSEWVRALQRPSGEPSDPAAVQKTLDQAKDLLASGVRRMSAEGEIDDSVIAAVHALTQIYLQENRPDEAVALLDDPVVGLMTLVHANHPATTRQGYDVEICKTALRAYVAARRLDKAEKVMDVLEQRVAAGGDAAAAARLTAVYLAMSRELRESLELLRAQGRTNELAKVSEGFELFLDRVVRRKQGNTFASLAWIAATFADMAGQSDDDGKTPSPEAEKYLGRAGDVYRKMLDRCKKEPGFAPSPAAVDGVKVRLARILRRLGRYDEAIDLLVDVLRNRNRMVDAQVEAARVYQDSAENGGDAKKYLEAMMGGTPARRSDGSRVNVVWGWGKLAGLIARSGSRPETFHLARYNLARCRYAYAMTLSGQAKKDTLALAEKDITVTQLLSPTLGGDQRCREYDALLKKIQAALGKQPVGLTQQTVGSRQ